MSLLARMHLQWRPFALLATVASLVPRADAGSRISVALQHCRACMLSGGVVDLYSQTTGQSLPACVARGLCPPGAEEVHRTCVAPADPWQAREIVVTLQVACDRNCMSSNGVDDSGTLWLALARLLRVPLQETHAAMLLMDTYYRQTYPIEHFTLRRSGETLLFRGPGSTMEHPQTWDLYLAIRVHSSRAAASGDGLRSILRGEASGLTSLVGMPGSKVHVFNSAERRTTSVQSAGMLRAMYKLRGLGWNEEPPRVTGGSSSSRPAPAPAPAPTPRPATTRSTTEAPAPQEAPSPMPRHEGCDRSCSYWKIGDGNCDAPCSNEACGWDGGDCHGQNGAGNSGVTPGCGCSAGWLGNGICESFCNYEACHYDGGDCDGLMQATQPPLPNPTPVPPAPAPTPSPCSCNARWLGDGICDTYCNIEACNFDGGDCPQSRDYTGQRASPAPVPAQTAPPRPTPAPAGSSPSLRATKSPPQAFSNSKARDDTQDHTQVVNFDVQNDNSQGGDDTWRVVATPDTGGAKGFYADGGSDDKKKSNPLMSALILAIFFVATSCLGGIAICIVTRHARQTTRRLAMRPNARTEAYERKDEGWTFEGWGQPPLTSAQKAGGRRNSTGTARADEHSARRFSKESNSSQRSWDTASTRTSASQDNDASSPSSFGSPGSSRTPSRPRNPFKEPKVHPEPDAAHWTRQSQVRRNSEAHLRGESKEPPSRQQRRHSDAGLRSSSADAGLRSNSADAGVRSNLRQAAYAEESRPQPAPPPLPVNFRKQSTQFAASSGTWSEARSASKTSASTPRASVPKASTPSASTPKAAATPRAAATPKAAATPRASAPPKAAATPRASVPKATEPRASVPTASQPKASVPKASASEPKTADARKRAQASAPSAGRSWFPSWGSKDSQPSKKDEGQKAKPARQKEEPPRRSASAPPAQSSGWPWSRSGATSTSSSSSATSAGRSSSATPTPTPQQQQKAAKKAEKKADALTVTTMKTLEHARTQPLEERKKVFRDLQRQLHPDKNIDQADAAKLAFQRLMEQRASFLAL
mmetsp:Transcript_108148/g.187756  ORF Transcript_108148/g.187756 Transcript_108148/m.187756 type:complete len:1043 (-) Transcript_108148:116-3244(-)